MNRYGAKPIHHGRLTSGAKPAKGALTTKAPTGWLSRQIRGLAAQRPCRHNTAKPGDEPRRFKTPASIIPEPEMPELLL